MSRREDIGNSLALLATAPYSVGLWIVLGDGTTTGWAAFWAGIALVVLSTALSPGFGLLLLGVPVTGAVLLAKGVLDTGAPGATLMIGIGLVLATLTAAGVVAARRAMGDRSAEADLRQRGQRCRALVMDVETTGWGTEFTRNVVLHLLVEPPGGGEALEVTQKHHVHLATPFRAGDELPVWVDPSDRTRVLVTVPGDDDYPAPDELAAFGIEPPSFEGRR